MNVNGTAETLLRATAVTLQRPGEYVARRLEARAQEMSEAQRWAAVAELLNGALQQYTLLVYETLDGVPVGHDPHTGMTYIPAPWTTSSYRRWCLRRSEQAIMAELMHLWQRKPRRPPVFVYAPELRRWCANIIDYPTIQEAGPVVERGAFSPAMVARTAHRLRADDLRRKRG